METTGVLKIAVASSGLFQGNPHGDDRVEDGFTRTVLDLDVDFKLAGIRPLRESDGLGNRDEIGGRFLQVLNRHAFRNPAVGSRNRYFGQHAAGHFRHVAHGDRVYRADVVKHRSMLAYLHAAIAGTKLGDRRTDACEVRRSQAHQTRKKPLAGRFGR